MCVCVCVCVCSAPAPNNVQMLTSNQCLDRKHNHQQWFYTRPQGGNCKRIESLEDLFDVDGHQSSEQITADNIVFVFQFPNPRDGRELSMSRLHQTMLSVFTVTINFDNSYSSGKYTPFMSRVEGRHYSHSCFYFHYFLFYS